MHIAATINLHEPDADALRATIAATFASVWEHDEGLFAVLADERAFTRRADPLRHPLIFYLGHTACFYVNKLMMAGLIQERVEPRCEALFAIGVDEMSWDDLDERHYDWPPVAEVWGCGARVRTVVEHLVATLPLQPPITWDDPWWALLMGIEHARIHLETSSVLIRQLPLDLLQPSPAWPLCPQDAPPPANELVAIPAGAVELGKPRDHRFYGWDNEYGHQVSQVPAFAAARLLVSNHEYRGFVEDGGYQEQRWWSEEGWAWCSWKQPRHPLFWRPDGATWRLRCLAQEIPMPWSWPVEVNCHEATAFCAWLAQRTGRSLRLPSEEEWLRLRDHCLGPADQDCWPAEPGNIALRHWASSCPVGRFVHGPLSDVIGNVWQWTSSPIQPLPGFRVHPWYDDFSVPTFDDRHNLICGGSWISTGNEATRHARYAFRRHFFQHAGLRYIEAAAPPPPISGALIDDAQAAAAALDDWGHQEPGRADDFPARLAALAVAQAPAHDRILHMGGGGGGRLAFLLARHFGAVVALERSARFLMTGDRLSSQGRVRLLAADEGALGRFVEIALEDADRAVADRIAFLQADPANLDDRHGRFPAVIVTDTLDQIADPRRALDRLIERLLPGGLLIIACPWQWQDDLTPAPARLGGSHDATGERLSAHQALHDHLAGRCELIEPPQDCRRLRYRNQRCHLLVDEQISLWRRVDET